ncbi:hypothetical protein [Ralstonia sp. Ralssp135]|jgi:hypothetical protein|uniref:hypothetical protein n=1 Tax=Ralstonia sp. Ralssp135 TaxID=3243016 RepID=UPI0039AF43D3
MHLSDTEAAQRVADNDNLVGELVEAINILLVCMKLAGWEGDWAAVNARAVLAKAQGAQQ